MKVARPRVRDRAGKEVSLESWQALRDQPAARVGAQPDGAERVDPQVPPRGPSARGRPGESAWHGTSKSAVSRRFVALSRKNS